MKAPFFSILLPTKNRSAILGETIESVLAQTFSDFELVISDNDDSPTATAEVVSKYKDPRIRYLRTSGNLSMHENWDNALLNAQGEYILVMEDKMRFFANSLEIFHRCLSENPGSVVAYNIKLPPSDVPKTLNPLPKPFLCRSTETIESFCRFTPQIFGRLPKGFNCCAPKEIVRQIKSSSPTGFAYSFINPDYAFAFMLLSRVPDFWYFNEAIAYIPLRFTAHYSNGGAFSKKEASAQRFLKQLPVPREEIIKNVPVKTEWLSINIILYDFFTKYRRSDHRPDINWRKYYGYCIILILMGKSSGGNMDIEVAELKNSLRKHGLLFNLGVFLDVMCRISGVLQRRAIRRLTRDWPPYN